MTKIIRTNIVLPDFINKISGLRLEYARDRNKGWGATGSWIVEKSSNKEIAYIPYNDKEIYLSYKYEHKYLKQLIGAMNKYERESGKRIDIIVSDSWVEE